LIDRSLDLIGLPDFRFFAADPCVLPAEDLDGIQDD
jgi:hypothetical protein